MGMSLVTFLVPFVDILSFLQLAGISLQRLDVLDYGLAARNKGYGIFILLRCLFNFLVAPLKGRLSLLKLTIVKFSGLI